MKNQSFENESLIEELDLMRQRLAILEQREAEFRFLAENMGDVAFMVDMELRTTYVSPSIEKVLGYTVEERIAQKSDEQLTPKSQKLVFETLIAELELEKMEGSDKNRSFTLELEYYHKDGSIKCLETYVRGMRDSNGNLTGFYGLSRDITSRKKAEDELLSQSEFNRLVIENASRGICVCHEIQEFPHLRFTVWNKYMTMITGYSMEEINRLGWYQSMYPDPAVQKQAITRMQSMRAGNDILGEEWEIVRADGQKRQLLITTRLMTGSKDKPYFLGVINDITERKLAEQEMRTKEEQHRMFLESLPIGLYRNTPGTEGRFIMINTALARLHGFDSIEEFFNRDVKNLYFDSAKRKEISAELVEKGFVSEKEVMLKKKDGTPFWASITARAIRDHEGKVMYFDGSVTDITDRKKMEEEIIALSIIDQLSGLNNRRGFLSLAEQQLKLSNRNKTGTLLFFADLDSLKWINDNLGHEEGDKALIEAATVLKDTFRTSDIIARLGGDEYAVLAVNMTEADSEIINARLKHLIDKQNYQENRKYTLSISVGCSYYDPDNPCSLDELIARADKLMYEQKQKNKNRFGQMTSISNSNP